MSLEVHGGRSFAEATILYDKAVDALGKRVNDEDSDYDEDALEKDKKILKRELEVSAARMLGRLAALVGRAQRARR